MPIKEADIINRIEELRKTVPGGRTQADFADKAGIALSTYTGFITGETAIFGKTFLRIIRALGMSLDEFFAPLIAESQVPGILSEAFDYTKNTRELTEYYEGKISQLQKQIDLQQENIVSLRKLVCLQESLISMDKKQNQ